MARSSWKSYLRISLVSVPVRGYTAHRSSGTVSLHQLHEPCHSRIRYQKICPVHGEVSQREIVSGYEYADDQYVVIEPNELDKLRTDADKAITVQAIVPRGTIDPVYFAGDTYYLVPDGAAGQKPYQLLQKCLAEDKLEAVAQFVLRGREELVLVRPAGKLLAINGLKYAAEVSPSAPLEEEVADSHVSAEEVTLTKTLLKAFEKKRFSIDAYKDPYVDKLKTLIEAKVHGRELVTPPPSEVPHVINLMDALRKSVAEAGGEPTPSKETNGQHPRAKGKRKAASGNGRKRKSG